MSELIINDSNYRQFLPHAQNAGHGYGLIPRDYSQHPIGSYAAGVPFDDAVPLIPMVEWPDWISDHEANKTSLRHALEGIEPLDQNGQGFCWSYSTSICIMAVRRLANMPDVRLSPHGMACKIYNHQDRGAWGAVSFDFASKYGVPPESHWPQQSMSRQYDNPSTWEAAKQYQLTEGFIDLEVSHPADADMSKQQVGSALLQLIPVVGDFNWWGHSVGLFNLVDSKPSLPATDFRRYSTQTLNSWGTSWGERGWGTLADSKAWPDGGCAPRWVAGS